MNQIKFFLLFSLFTNAFSGLLFIDRRFVLGDAVRALLIDCKHRKSKINFVHGNGNSSNDIFDDLLKQIEDFSVQIENFHTALKPQRVKKSFVIIYASDANSILQFCDKISDESFHFTGFYLIILELNLQLEIKKIFEIFWRKFIFNVNVVAMERSSANAFMYTFMPFNGISCGDVSPIKINEFNAITLKWEFEVVFPRKFRNLQGCPIKVGTYDNAPGTIIVRGVDNSTRYQGFEVDYINGIAEALNFKVELQIFPINTGKFFDNKTANGLMNRAYSQEVDLIFALLSLQQVRTEFLSETRMFYCDKIILVIPKSLLIGPMKKLLLPFELFTWVGLLILLFVACLVIAILKFSPRRFHDFIAGKSSRNDYLNLWIILLGGSQPKLPFRNFARFLQMSFVMFCLVMRSSYTGSLFNIIKNDISSTELNSIDELVDLEFDFYIYESLAARLKEEKFTKR